MNNINNFLNFIEFEKRYSNHTYRSYRTDLLQFQRFCHSKGLSGPEEASHKLIRTWVVMLMDEGRSAKTVNRKISSLKSFYKFLLREGTLSESPMDRVVSPKNEKNLPAFVGEASMDVLLDQCDFGSDYSGVRNKLIVEMLYVTGMRRAELIHLKVGDLYLEELRIKVLGKRNKERLIPVSKVFAETLAGYLDIRRKQFPDGHETLFLTDKGSPVYPEMVYRVVRKYLQLVTTLESKSPHILRHSFATHMLNKGADINAIKELLGHANLSATQIYTHNTFEKLKKIYKQAHPRA